MKNISIYITIGGIVVGFITGYVRLQAQAQGAQDRVERLEVQVDEVQKDNAVLDKAVELNKAEQANTSKQVQKVDGKVDEVIKLLLDMKKGK